MSSLVTLAAKLNRAGHAWPGVRVWDGRFSATSFDRLLYLYLHKWGAMGTHHRARLARHITPGMTIVDVGANLGLYTFVLSRLVGEAGRVIAFEPEPTLFQCLQRNCDANGLRNVTLHNVAVGATSGMAALIPSALHSGDTRVRDGAAGPGTTPVRVVTLDEVLGDIRPDFAKIDVQGFELRVLRGMAGTLARTPRLKVYVEFWPWGLRHAGDEPIELLRLLHSQSFSLYTDERGADRPIPDLAAFTARFTRKYSLADVFAVRE